MATSRRFTKASSDQVVVNNGPNLTGAFTQLIVLKIIEATDLAWMSFVENERTSDNEARPSLGRRNNGQIYCSNRLAIQSAITIEDADGWMIVAATKAAGTATPRAHKCVIGGANTHTDMGGTLGDDTAGTWTLRIGGNEDFADMEVAAAAEWLGTVLSDADIDGIASAKTTQSIADLAPTVLYDASNVFATNIVNAGTNDPASVQTSAGASDPSGWVYGLGGVVTPAPKLRTVQSTLRW